MGTPRARRFATFPGECGKMAKKDIDRLIDAVGLRQADAQRRVAAILFTYRCSIACRHCLFGCAADRPQVVMSARQCADGLALLHETGRVVHVAGGEPMLYWDVLSEAIRLADMEGHAPHFVETNCSFAKDEVIVRERFDFLAAHGVKGIYASADPFHQEFVLPENFLRVRRLTKAIFGEKNFYGPENDEGEIRDFRTIAFDEARRREYVRTHIPGMVGSAGKKLAQYLDGYVPHDRALPSYTWQACTQEANCRAQFLADTIRELHLDPYGNIQTNCGMVLGRLPEMTPARLLAAGPEQANRFVQTVCKKGAVGLMELAQREYGFAPPERVTQTCELCYRTRGFLRKFHPDVFGPAEVYD